MIGKILRFFVHAAITLALAGGLYLASGKVFSQPKPEQAPTAATDPESKKGPSVAASPAYDSIETLCVAEKRKKIKEEWTESNPQMDSKQQVASQPLTESTQQTADLKTKLKKVEYEICEAWIRAHFKTNGRSDQLIALLDGIERHKANARDSIPGVTLRSY